MHIFSIALFGALGTLLRYGITLLSRGYVGASLPGTLAVNLLGSFMMGWVTQSTQDAAWRTTLTTGLLGGFTTYSAFNQEALELYGQRGPLWGGLYGFGTLLGCLGAGFFGNLLARR